MVRKKNALPGTSLGLPADYAALLESLKARVHQAHTKALLSVNRERRKQRLEGFEFCHTTG